MSDSDDEPSRDASPRTSEWGVVLAGLAPDASDEVRARGVKAAETIAGMNTSTRNAFPERPTVHPTQGHLSPIATAMQALRRVPPEQLYGIVAGIRSLFQPNQPAYRSAPTAPAAPAAPATTSTTTQEPSK